MSDWFAQKFPNFASAVGDYRILGHHRAKGKCPNTTKHARGDKHFSLIMKVGDDTGSCVFRCQAGCHREEILHAAGLKWRDVCADAPKGKYVVPQIVHKYAYNDPDGNPAYEVARYHPKSFKPRRKLPQCGPHWIYNLLGGVVKRVDDREDGSCYKWIDAGKRLGDPPGPGEVSIPPAVMWPYQIDVWSKAIDRLLLFVEGEGVADVAMSLGFLATTTQGGSNNFTFNKAWAKYFKGRHVVIVPDNDDTGRKYARYYAGCFIDACAATVSILHLKGLQEKDDLKNWAFYHRQNENDVGPNSTPAIALRSEIAKLSGYGRGDLKKLLRGH